MMCIAGCLHGSALALALCCPRAMCCALAPGTPCTLGTPLTPWQVVSLSPVSLGSTQARLGARCHKATLR